MEGDRLTAAVNFDRAFAGRRSPARKSVALFWAARSLDIAEEKSETAIRYERLRSDFPESYWYPESVFRLIEINLLRNDSETAEALYMDLVETVPDNLCTRKAGKIIDEIGAR